MGRGLQSRVSMTLEVNPKHTAPTQKLLTRLAFKGDQEVFTASWTKVRSKDAAIDQEVAGPLILAFIQHLLEGGVEKQRLVNCTVSDGPQTWAALCSEDTRFPVWPELSRKKAYVVGTWLPVTFRRKNRTREPGSWES